MRWDEWDRERKRAERLTWRVENGKEQRQIYKQKEETNKQWTVGDGGGYKKKQKTEESR